MTTLTKAQKAELAAFFWDHADAQRKNGFDTDGVLTVNFIGRLYWITDSVELCQSIRSNFDDYEDVFELLEQHSDELAQIVEDYWAEA